MNNMDKMMILVPLELAFHPDAENTYAESAQTAERF